MLDIKALLTKIINRLTGNPEFVTWSDVAPTASAQKNIASITLKKNTTYLVLARNGNGIGTAQICNVNLALSNPGAATTFYNGSATSSAGGGNNTIGWGYVETGSTANTLYIQSYGYVTTARFNGAAIAIPLFRREGGYCVASVIAMLSAIGRWWEHVRHQGAIHKNIELDDRRHIISDACDRSGLQEKVGDGGAEYLRHILPVSIMDYDRDFANGVQTGKGILFFLHNRHEQHECDWRRRCDRKGANTARKRVGVGELFGGRVDYVSYRLTPERGCCHA